MGGRRPLIAGNWKMHGRGADLAELKALSQAIGAAPAVEALICPPAPYIGAALKAAEGTAIAIGAQDCSGTQADAARTGEYSAAMLADVGAKYVIVGHSERRALCAETDTLVRQKAEAALAAGLIPIICLGETEAERMGGRTLDVISRQLAGSVPDATAAFVVAYEPVWAIGGTRTPTLAEIDDVHGLIRRELTARFGAAGEGTRILYGGSVGPKNAAEIFSCADVDGALVGRASLKAADFSAIILAHPAQR